MARPTVERYELYATAQPMRLKIGENCIRFKVQGFPLLWAT